MEGAARREANKKQKRARSVGFASVQERFANDPTWVASLPIENQNEDWAIAQDRLAAVPGQTKPESWTQRVARHGKGSKLVNASPDVSTPIRDNPGFEMMRQLNPSFYQQNEPEPLFDDEGQYIGPADNAFTRNATRVGEHFQKKGGEAGTATTLLYARSSSTQGRSS